MGDEGQATREGGGARRLRIAARGGAAFLLLAPLVAMQFTDEVRWTAFDFAVFAALLAAALGAFELGLRGATDVVARLAVVVAVGAGFLLVWAQLAVGVVGKPGGRVFAAVVALVIAAAVAVRVRRPRSQRERA
jgi:peptidoglycan/LPS O-acetylase OafA/YrhL